MYYARGSLFETKYWLNRVSARELLSSAETQTQRASLTALARQLNTFASSLKSVRSNTQSKTLRELAVEYQINAFDIPVDSLFSSEDLDWLQSPITNY